MKYLVTKLMMHIKNHFHKLPVIIFGLRAPKKGEKVIKSYNSSHFHQLKITAHAHIIEKVKFTMYKLQQFLKTGS